MKNLVVIVLLMFFSVTLSGCNLSKAINARIDEDYYCVVNRDIIVFYNPVTDKCTPFGTERTFGDTECSKVKNLYSKGDCRLKKDACTNFGRGEQPTLGCINNKKESLRILLTPKPKE